jgi:hypothetical protein
VDDVVEVLVDVVDVEGAVVEGVVDIVVLDADVDVVVAIGFAVVVVAAGLRVVGVVAAGTAGTYRTGGRGAGRTNW